MDTESALAFFCSHQPDYWGEQYNHAASVRMVSTSSYLNPLRFEPMTPLPMLLSLLKPHLPASRAACGQVRWDGEAYVEKKKAPMEKKVHMLKHLPGAVTLNRRLATVG